jgi:hypothetical protein
VLDRLQPLGVAAALAAIEARSQPRSAKSSQPRSAKKGQRELAAQQLAMKPLGRSVSTTRPIRRLHLVTGELERRWNQRLVAVRDLELEIDRLDADQAPVLTAADRERLMALGRDLVRAWESPGTTPETVISAIIVAAGEQCIFSLQRNRAHAAFDGAQQQASGAGPPARLGSARAR